jgi:flagellar biosynthesis/type III secretory pathway protein FliH
VTQPTTNNDLPKPTYSNLEIVNMMIVALAKGSPDAVKGEFEDSIIVRSWKAMDDTFRNGYKQGREKGYREGYNAARAELMAEEEAAEAAAHQVIEGLCQVVWKQVG